MQRFADRPFSTWRTIELALKPYEARMQAGSEISIRVLVKRRKLLDEVMSALNKLPERTSDVPLSGEFLLGYHCQRAKLNEPKPQITTAETIEPSEAEETS